MMGNIHEAINKSILIRKSTASPVTVSSVVGIVSEEQRCEKFDAFFQEKDNNRFTYTVFKSMFRTSIKLDTPFKWGIDNEKFIAPFAERKEGEKSGYTYDEYIETLFMYLYYQVFIKTFLSADRLENKKIGEARALLAKTSAKGAIVLESKMKDLMKILFSMVIPDMGDGNVRSDKKAMQTYIEDFANSNEKLFTEYPFSAKVPSQKMTIPGLIDFLYNQCITQSATLSNQLKHMMVFESFFIEDSLDFDSSRIAKKFNKENIIGDDATASTLNEIINVLYEGVDESALEKLSMGWAKNTRWNNVIRMVYAFMSIRKLSLELERSSYAYSEIGQGFKYVKRLDTDEKDGGIKFVNNMAFYSAIQKSAYSNVVYELNNMILKLNAKVEKFNALPIEQRVEAVLFVPAPILGTNDWFVPLYAELSEDEKSSISRIMEITGLRDVYPGLGTEDIIENINRMFYEINDENVRSFAAADSEFLPDFSKVAQYAARNVSDYVIPGIEVEDLGIKDFAEGAFEMTKDIVVTFPIELATSMYNDFSKGDYFGMFLNAGKKFVDAGESVYKKMKGIVDQDSKISQKTVEYKGREVWSIGDFAGFREMTSTLSYSVPSMLYHGKVIFAQSGGSLYASSEESKLNETTYTNWLSYWIISVSSRTNVEAYKAAPFKLDSRVTPFFLEFMKYSLRYFINNLEKLPTVDDSLRERLTDAADKDNIPAAEWKELTDELSIKIRAYYRKELDSGSINDSSKNSGEKTTFPVAVKATTQETEKEKKVKAQETEKAKAEKKKESSGSAPSKAFGSSKYKHVIIDAKDVKITVAPEGKRLSFGQWISQGEDNFVNLSFFKKSGAPVGRLIIGSKEIGSKEGSKGYNWPLLVIAPYVGKVREEKKPELAFSGSNILVMNGQAASIKKTRFTTASVRRTCIGVNAEQKIVVMTSSSSTLEEAAQRMKDLGCDYAINVDGGGSTMMAVDGKKIMSGSNRVPVILSW